MKKRQVQGVAGQVLHITQRCYEQKFLLNAETDRRRWLYWLYQARRRFDISVLNYVVTSNHVHILIQDHSGGSVAGVMDMINQRTNAELNRNRRCALWAPGFQTTAVQTNEHLARCMAYIDTNMVRAAVVAHPVDWRCGGYYESLYPKARGGRIDHSSLRKLLQFKTSKALQAARDQWIDVRLNQATMVREPYWSDSIAVGDLGFALKMKRFLAYADPGRRAQRERGCFAVR